MASYGKLILVTGATGYIGSHLCVKLLKSGYRVIGVDNLSRSNRRVWDVVTRDFSDPHLALFYEVDVHDIRRMTKLLDGVYCVIHLAGYKSIGESVNNTVYYYYNNLGGTISLIKAMNDAGVKDIIFSSTASVYGEGSELTEESDIRPTNPYSETKRLCEVVLEGMPTNWNCIILRYFNPVGVNKQSGLKLDRGENLMSVLYDLHVGDRKEMVIFGNDYDTADGTPIRDYIHIDDLVEAHILAIDNLSGKKIYNVGTNIGTSVLEFINSVESVTGRGVNYRAGDRRRGDVAVCTANADKIQTDWNWRAKHSIIDSCRSVFE